MDIHHLLLEIVAVCKGGIAEDDPKVKDGFRGAFEELSNAGGVCHAQANEGQ